MGHARQKQWTRLLAQLRSPGCDVRSCDELGRTALHYAAGYGMLDVVRALIAAGAAVGAADRFGMTPLHWATQKDHGAVAEELLAADADAFVAATAGVFKGRSALDICRSPELRDQLTASLGSRLFEQRKLVGRGGYGTVIKAIRRDTGEAVALKAVRKSTPADLLTGASEVGLHGAKVERDVLSALEHPFVVGLHSAFQDGEHLYLALDFCAGGDLALHVRAASAGRLDEPTARFLAAELALAVSYLHEHGVIHRDIKSENILIDAWGHVRLADMNVSKQGSELALGGRTYTVKGTPKALAPEVIKGDGYTIASDWWSFGVVLFEMLSGQPPFPRDATLAMAHAHLIHEILHGEPAPTPEGTSGEATRLLAALLQKEESRRLSRPHLIRADAFFADVRWGALLAKQLPSPLLLDGLTTGSGLDVFAYPSDLPDHLDGALLSPRPNGHDSGGEAATLNGATPPAETGLAAALGFAGASSPRLRPAEADVPDWDYVAPEAARGARLWARVRSSIDQQARLRGMSRLEYLIFVIMTTAADEATGVERRPAFF